VGRSTDHGCILEWTNGLLEDVEATFARFWEQKPGKLVTKYNHVMGELVESPHVRTLPIQDEWTLRIGVALRCMSVALDYLAFRIVNRHPAGPMVHKVGFPICADRTKYAQMALVTILAPFRIGLGEFFGPVLRPTRPHLLRRRVQADL
jgi:hypothetical protein